MQINLNYCREAQNLLQHEMMANHIGGHHLRAIYKYGPTKLDRRRKRKGRNMVESQISLLLMRSL